jgi:hypothetical protein
MPQKVRSPEHRQRGNRVACLSVQVLSRAAV